MVTFIRSLQDPTCEYSHFSSILFLTARDKKFKKFNRRFLDCEMRVTVEKQKKQKLNNDAAVNSLLPDKGKIPHFQFQELTCPFFLVVVKYNK